MHSEANQTNKTIKLISLPRSGILLYILSSVLREYCDRRSLTLSIDNQTKFIDGLPTINIDEQFLGAHIQEHSQQFLAHSERIIDSESIIIT